MARPREMRDIEHDRDIFMLGDWERRAHEAQKEEADRGGRKGGREHANLRLIFENAALADVLFTELMGEDVDSPRKIIQRNPKDVRFLDI